MKSDSPKSIKHTQAPLHIDLPIDVDQEEKSPKIKSREVLKEPDAGTTEFDKTETHRLDGVASPKATILPLSQQQPEPKSERAELPTTPPAAEEPLPEKSPEEAEKAQAQESSKEQLEREQRIAELVVSREYNLPIHDTHGQKTRTSVFVIFVLVVAVLAAYYLFVKR